MASLLPGAMGRFGSLLLLASLAPMPALAAVPHDICASFNTAGTNRNTSIYQTNGLCSDFCKDDYAYAITQEEACWCSNFTPSSSSQVSKGRCDEPCPAYPDEMCGGRGLFSYVEMNGKLPEGSKGPNPATTRTDPITETTHTISTDGTIRTVTVMPTSDNGGDGGNGGDADGSQNGSDGNNGGGGGLGTGAVAGIAIGVIAAVLIAVGAVLFWFFKRRKRNQQDGYQGDPSVRGDSSDRMGSAHPEMSMAAGRNGSPSSNMGSSNRNSTLAIDPRMDPFKQGLYTRNGPSQESINTLRDDHDYSRRIQQPKVLRATNPDPE